MTADSPALQLHAASNDSQHSVCSSHCSSAHLASAATQNTCRLYRVFFFCVHCILLCHRGQQIQGNVSFWAQALHTMASWNRIILRFWYIEDVEESKAAASCPVWWIWGSGEQRLISRGLLAELFLTCCDPIIVSPRIAWTAGLQHKFTNWNRCELPLTLSEDSAPDGSILFVLWGVLFKEIYRVTGMVAHWVGRVECWLLQHKNSNHSNNINNRTFGHGGTFHGWT